MSVIKVRGIVLNAYDAGESDKVLTLLTKEYGKIRAGAKGARKGKSKYLAGSQLFTYADFVLYSGRDFYSITQIDIIENFYALRTDYDGMCYGNYFLELIDKTTYDNSPNDPVLRLLLKSLQVLNGENIPAALTARIFEFKYLQLMGYQPETDRCVQCGQAYESEPVYFGLEGYICPLCAAACSFKAHIGYSALYAVRYIMEADLKTLFQFQLEAAAYEDLKKASDIFIKNFDVTLKSKELIDQDQ